MSPRCDAGSGPFCADRPQNSVPERLLQVGFDTLDFGSFVSPKAIPQMRDTADVLAGLTWRRQKPNCWLLSPTVRGAEQAVAYPPIQYVGFPLSVSETFQQRNTNKSIVQAFAEVGEMQNVYASEMEKKLVVYLSMGFGNPYGDPYSPAWLANLRSN